MTAVFASPPEPGTRPKYPFAEWLDGRRWTLVRGRDFWGSPGELRRSVQSAANARRVKVEMSVEGGTFTIQAVSHG